MNYCDDNGCMNRKRELVEPKEMLVKMMQDEEELELYEEPNIIDKWLEENGTPEIAKQVELEAEQETLEEASEKRYPFGDGFQIMDIDISETLQLAFINGAKWQQERSYSEEEVNNLLYLFLEQIFSINKIQYVLLNGLKNLKRNNYGISKKTFIRLCGFFIYVFIVFILQYNI